MTAQKTTDSNEGVECPYCGHLHGDAWEYSKDYRQEMTCDECGKVFDQWAEYDATYYAKARPSSATPEDSDGSAA